MNNFRYLLIISFTMIGCVTKSNNIITVKDIDGNVYKAVKIGNQVWTVENLKTTKYNDGTEISYIKDAGNWENYNFNSNGAYCFYKNDPANKIKYGALYNWHAVNTGKLAPKGWHVPTKEEWVELEEYLIANGYNWDGSKVGNKIAKSLAAKTDWKTNVMGTAPIKGNIGVIGQDLKKNNSSGFTGRPGGFRKGFGYFDELGLTGVWWSSTESDSLKAYLRALCFGLANVGILKGADYKSNGFSVRLLLD